MYIRFSWVSREGARGFSRRLSCRACINLIYYHTLLFFSKYDLKEQSNAPNCGTNGYSDPHIYGVGIGSKTPRGRPAE